MKKSFFKGILLGVWFAVVLFAGWFFVDAKWTDTKSKGSSFTAAEFNAMVSYIQEVRSDVDLLKNKACPGGYFDANWKCCMPTCSWTVTTYSNFKDPFWKSLADMAALNKYMEENKNITTMNSKLFNNCSTFAIWRISSYYILSNNSNGGTWQKYDCRMTETLNEYEKRWCIMCAWGAQNNNDILNCSYVLCPVWTTLHAYHKSTRSCGTSDCNNNTQWCSIKNTCNRCY